MSATNDIPITEAHAERLWAKVDKSGDCWLWTGGLNTHGYGQLGVGRRLVLAHRIAWTLEYGPIPDGLQVLHACDNPACVRPTHLMLGSQTANLIDAGRKGRLKGGQRRVTCRRGHPLTEDNIYVFPSTGTRRCRTCMDAFYRAWNAKRVRR